MNLLACQDRLPEKRVMAERDSYIFTYPYPQPFKEWNYKLTRDVEQPQVYSDMFFITNPNIFGIQWHVWWAQWIPFLVPVLELFNYANMWTNDPAIDPLYSNMFENPTAASIYGVVGSPPTGIFQYYDVFTWRGLDTLKADLWVMRYQWLWSLFIGGLWRS